MSEPGTTPKREGLRLVLLGVMAGCLVAVAFSSIYGTSLLLGNSDSAKHQRADQIALSERIIECTTRPDLREPPVATEDLPANDCYKQQQAGAADFASPTGPFGVLVAVSSACGSAHPGDIPATQACVVKALRP